MMTKETLISRLLELPSAIAEAEGSVLENEDKRQQVADALQRIEDELLLNGIADGKNAEIRAAQVRSMTADTREVLVLKEQAKARALVEVRQLTHEFSALRNVARLLSGGDL